MIFLTSNNWPETSKLNLLNAFDRDNLDIWGFTVSRANNYGIMRIDNKSSQLTH